MRGKLCVRIENLRQIVLTNKVILSLYNQTNMKQTRSKHETKNKTSTKQM